VVTAVRASRTERAFAAVGAVADPELPGLTLHDLGILRDVTERDGTLIVTVAPTYSGCPALREILQGVHAALARAAAEPFEVQLSFQPPWTSDWITEEGRGKLAAAGIAPPQPALRPAGPVPLTLVPPPRAVTCPSCGSRRTSERARFGATACRALYRCDDCREPFEYLKDI
jgi:ring-1,2-phenylacetyl-CoA epoxidase subunit PaaD